MRVTVASVAFCAILLAPAAAGAQFRARPFSEPAIGETYHVEVSGTFWNPTPGMTLESEGLGIIGSDIDAVNDLGVVQKRFRELQIVLRPATKHKFRADYMPVEYTANATLTREFVFNGLRYRIGLPVSTKLRWNVWRFAYEYDFLYRDRWFVGFVAAANQTDIRLDLESAIGAEYAHARAPVPAVGGIVRGYVASNVSITGELTWLKVTASEDTLRHVDFNLYGTVNFNDHAGVQLGYRKVNLQYEIDQDRGDLRLDGIYFGGVARF
jgi:hypothetical protein